MCRLVRRRMAQDGPRSTGAALTGLAHVDVLTGGPAGPGVRTSLLTPAAERCLGYAASPVGLRGLFAGPIGSGSPSRSFFASAAVPGESSPLSSRSNMACLVSKLAGRSWPRIEDPRCHRVLPPKCRGS